MLFLISRYFGTSPFPAHRGNMKSAFFHQLLPAVFEPDGNAALESLRMMFGNMFSRAEIDFEMLSRDVRKFFLPAAQRESQEFFIQPFARFSAEHSFRKALQPTVFHLRNFGWRLGNTVRVKQIHPMIRLHKIGVNRTAAHWPDEINFRCDKQIAVRSEE